MFRPNIRLYNLFKKELKLPDAKAEELLTALDEKIQRDIENFASGYKGIWKEDLRLGREFRGKLKDSKMDIYKWLAIVAFLILEGLIIGLYLR